MNANTEIAAADELAAWCELRIEDFREAYEACINGTKAATWSVLGGQTPPDGAEFVAQLKRHACREALAFGVLTHLAVRVSQAQVTKNLADKGSADGIVARIARVDVGGHMQALVQGALLRRETLEGLLKVDAATAVVYAGTRAVGTAFLVAPDLILTAAHVVLRADEADFKVALSPGLSFSFRADASGQRVIAYAAGPDALVAYSLPWGRPPDKLFVPPTPGSAERLDFALVRLDRYMRHVDSVDIGSPPRTEARERLVVLGFPGGTAMAWDVGTVSAAGNERLAHEAGTLPGMSGSCCIDVNGKPVALHEGSLRDNTFSNGEPVAKGGENRAICLWAVRNAIPAGARDPLRLRSRAPGLAFRDQGLVQRWAKSGLRFAPANMQPAWIRLVTEAIGVAPEGTGTFPEFHPWFKRDTFESWVEQNIASERSDNRLCVVSGNPGTGKSFLAAILREKVGKHSDVVVISATETTAWSWREAITKWGVALDARGGLRPDAGVTMHDEVPQAAQRIAAHGDRTTQADTVPLFVAIDFDGVASFSLDQESPWLPFMAELLGYQWVRLIVIGAPESVTLGLTDRMQDEELITTLRIRLDHVDEEGFRRFARQLLRKGRASVPSNETDEALQSYRRILNGLSAAPLQTAATVLAAILLKRSVGE